MCFRGEVTTDEELHEFSAIAAVCTAWRDATAEVLARRRVLVHVRQLPNPPPPPPQLEQVSFVEIAAGSGELLVAEAHRISVLAPPVSDNAWTQKRQLGSGGTEAGCLFYPRGLAVSACGRKVLSPTAPTTVSSAYRCVRVVRRSTAHGRARSVVPTAWLYGTAFSTLRTRTTIESSY